jgi:ribosomal peptide maturation radical SAM protein 1
MTSPPCSGSIRTKKSRTSPTPTGASGIGSSGKLRSRSLPDNSVEYFRRYFPGKTTQGQRLQEMTAETRPRIGPLIEQLIDFHGLDRFDVVGFTSMFSQTVPSIAMARHIKARNPEAIVVMGGANCEAPMGSELAKNVDCIDYVFSGPSLKSFPRFIRLCADRELGRAGEIAGIFTTENSSSVCGKATIGEDLDIDDVIELDYQPFVDLVQKKWRDRDVQIRLPFETSRGCWWGERAHCTFCGLNGMTMAYRAMRPDHALRIINSLFRYEKVNQLMCVDNIMPKSYLKAVFPFLHTPDTIDIFYEVKADLSEHDLKLLAQARVNVLQPGIEALSTSTLKLMRKGTTSFSNISFLINCLITGVTPFWNLLVGFPGETADLFEKYLADIPTLVHLPPPDGAYPVRFDRYSPYFKDASQFGLNLEPMPFYELIYPFSKKDLENLAYFFADRNYSAEYLRAVASNLVPLQQAVGEWRQRWATGDPPQLRVQGHHDKTTIIYDSRPGPAETFELTAVAARVLRTLARRMGASELAAELPDIDRSEIAAALEDLKKRRLLFGERDRLMSIVVDRVAAAPDRADQELRRADDRVLSVAL